MFTALRLQPAAASADRVTTPVAKVMNTMSRSNCDDCPRVRALEAEVAKVRRKVEELTRAGKRQAAPFSKGKPKTAVPALLSRSSTESLMSAS